MFASAALGAAGSIYSTTYLAESLEGKDLASNPELYYEAVGRAITIQTILSGPGSPGEFLDEAMSAAGEE
ncbi:hypothetical protein [Limnobacter sp.]|mgnify:CR=1 FL=1|jgi:hypothetical protein|uniref:hypothetical protein n=1 Tax=Limnobacter sp. TaxID=2003368 RepID=UPI00311F0244